MTLQGAYTALITPFTADGSALFFSDGMTVSPASFDKPVTFPFDGTAVLDNSLYFVPLGATEIVRTDGESFTTVNVDGLRSIRRLTTAGDRIYLR